MSFDGSLMAPAEFEFVVLGDTHYMLDPGGQALEFASRRKQTDRSDAALRMAASLSPDFVVHMGDLVQEYPESLRHREAIDEAQAQLDRLNVEVFHVARQPRRGRQTRSHHAHPARHGRVPEAVSDPFRADLVQLRPPGVSLHRDQLPDSQHPPS